MQHETIELVLEDGKKFTGHSFGFKKSVSGEVVFNTAMTGYPESLTDPSYSGQLLVLTYPLIGNYGVPENIFEHNISKFFESEKLQISGLVISDYSYYYSHWNSKKSLSNWLKESKIPGIYGVDTRAITKYIREKGSMPGKIIYNNTDVKLFDPNKENIIQKLTTPEVKNYGNGQHKIILVDCGVKNNIIRCFLKRNVSIKRVPYDYDFTNEDYDALFLSNGPGDPKNVGVLINNVKKAIEKGKPIMGICLGCQILALAAGADTYKLKFGHRSHNQPVIDVDTKKCFVTSQNHGFAIDSESLPDNWKVLFKNVNDNTCEGIMHKSKPFFAVQFHPEAAGGPTDTDYLFDLFIERIVKYKKQVNG